MEGQNKRKALYFSQEKCGPCARIFEQVIAPKIIPSLYTGQFELILCDKEPSKAKAYHITKTPTLVLLNEDGTEWGRKIGDPSDRLRDILAFLTAKNGGSE